MRSWLEQLRAPAETSNLLQWFISLRWVVAGLQFLSLIPAFFIGFVDENNLWQYFSVMVLVPLVNTVFAFRSPRDEEESEKVRRWIMAGLCFDLIQLSVLLAMTGGWNNPFSSMVFIYAILASLALEYRQRIAFAVLLALDIVLLSKIFRSEIPNNVPWTEPFADTLVEVVVGISLMVITSSLITRLFQKENQVSQLKRSRLRMDRLRAIGALSSGVCHQLATPLNNMMLRSNRILRDMPEDDEDLRDNITSMQQSLEKAQNAVRRLAEIQVDPETSQFASVDIGELVESTVDSWMRTENNGRVAVKYNEFPSIMVQVPVGAITQVVLDLLDNAADSMIGSGGRVCLAMKGDDKNIYFSIRDEGPGFPKEVLQHLGEPFNSQKVGGSGLGIYHAKLISQLLRGNLKVENLERGALVTFTISRKPYGT